MAGSQTKNQEYTRTKGTSPLKFSILCHKSCTLLNQTVLLQSPSIPMAQKHAPHAQQHSTQNEKCSHAATEQATAPAATNRYRSIILAPERWRSAGEMDAESGNSTTTQQHNNMRSIQATRTAASCSVRSVSSEK